MEGRTASRVRRLVGIACLWAAADPLLAQPAPADLVLTGGRVYTFAWDEPSLDGTPAANAPRTGTGFRPDAEAIAVRGDRIVFVGTDREARAYRSGARLLDDYADRPGHRGVSGTQYGFDQALVADMMKAGFQIAIHAIGDAGDRETLDFIESVLRAQPESRALRHRIEHAQVLHPDDVPRFAKLGVIASMEPPHCVEDKAWAEARLGPQRVKGAYAWRAYAASWEKESGVLAAGRGADITVLDVDPLVVGPTNPGPLLRGSIVATIVRGRVAYAAPPRKP